MIILEKTSLTVEDVMEKNTKLNFTGQKLYVGIDVHKKTWNVTIVLNGMKVRDYQ